MMRQDSLGKLDGGGAYCAIDCACATALCLSGIENSVNRHTCRTNARRYMTGSDAQRSRASAEGPVSYICSTPGTRSCDPERRNKKVMGVSKGQAVCANVAAFAEMPTALEAALGLLCEVRRSARLKEGHSRVDCRRGGG